MTDLESFAAAARKRATFCGLTDIEIDEAAGAVLKTAALEAVSESPGGSALLVGSPGTGKTLAATRWLLRPVYSLGEWFISNGQWCARTRARWPFLFRTAKSLSRVAQYDEKSVEPLFSADRLVVDDLGQEYLDKSGFLVSLIDEIVSERHRRRLPTVMTANLSADEFGQRYGDRVVDRIVATGRLVVCNGDSLRRKVPKAERLPPLVTAEALLERRTDLAAGAAKLAADHAAQLDAREREWAERRKAPAVHVEIKSPAKVTMTDAEVQERKAFLARQVEELRARNPEPTT